MEGSTSLRACPKCGASEERGDSTFCPHCGAVLRTEGPQSSMPLSEAPDTEQTGKPSIVEEPSAAADKTIADEGEPASLQHARASGIEKPVATPAEEAKETMESATAAAAPPAFAPAPERLSAPESWLRPSAEPKKLPEADATSLDAKPPAMDDPTGPPNPVVAKAVAEKTIDDLPQEAKQALAGSEKAAALAVSPPEPGRLAKGTTAPHILPGHAAVEKMLSISTTPSVPIAIAKNAGRIVLAMALSVGAGVGYGFLRQQVGPDLVKALSLDPRGNVLNVAFAALFLVTSFAFSYGVFAATSKGWRRPKWRKV